jgi:DNA polymerase
VQSVVLREETDFDGWRLATRALVLSGVPPESITWSVAAPDDLRATEFVLPEASGEFRVPRAMVDLARLVILAREPARFALLYAMIWRIHHGERALLDAMADQMVVRARHLSSSVRRDMHKMRGFVRFRAVEEPEGRRHVAWFEPDHFIVEANAPFFVRRFATLVWSILTPDRSAHWDGATLALGPGVSRVDVPDDDALEAYWRAYFSSIFNSARLTVGATESKMPRRSWRTLPEAAAIPDLIGEAGSRADAMIEQEQSAVPGRNPQRLPASPSSAAATVSPLATAAAEAAQCRRCDLWERATQVVFGEGPSDARVMLVGEQPGDQEDVAGRPFVGPAGQMLDRALAEAGLDRRRTYVTNAVKHFKFEPRGKRRIHSKPDTTEIVACKAWLDVEMATIRPAVVVLLGATAARAVLGRTVTIMRERGKPIPMADGMTALVTVHPSFLLRLPDEASKVREYAAFVADLRRVPEIAGTR